MEFHGEIQHEGRCFRLATLLPYRAYARLRPVALRPALSGQSAFFRLIYRNGAITPVLPRCLTQRPVDVYSVFAPAANNAIEVPADDGGQTSWSCFLVISYLLLYYQYGKTWTASSLHSPLRPSHGSNQYRVVSAKNQTAPESLTECLFSP